MRKLLFAPFVALLLMGSGIVAAGDLVNVHIHGLTNAGRIQVHIHHVVSNIQVLSDGSLLFEILP